MSLSFTSSKVTAAAAMLLVTLAGASSASAQRPASSTIGGQSIFGGSYNIDIYRVGTDFSANPGTGVQLEPEGMVFHNGVLYVSGDGGATETNGFLASYAGGNLGFLPSVIGPFISANAAGTLGRFGGEGITINTRGAGYGSFGGTTPNIASIDNVISGVGRQLAVMNLTGISVQNQQNGFVNADDITFVLGTNASDDRFAIINAASAPVLRYYSTGSTPTLLAGGFALPLGAKGLLHLSAVDAAKFSALATGEAFLVASSPEGALTTNRLTLYAMDGTLLVESMLPTGLGAGRLGNIEAIAFDSVTNRLFIGDEAGANSQIAVLTIPSPAGAAMVAMAGLMIARRRRS